MNLVWLHGPDGRQHSEELRYSIRSVTQNLMGNHRVWVVGWAPCWLNLDRVTYLPVPTVGDKHEATRASMLAVCSDDRLPDNFLYLNDDMYILSPVAGVPIWHRGRLRDAAGPTRWFELQHEADAWLRANGVESPLNYELHIPLTVNRHLMRSLLQANPQLPCKRSVYANLAQMGGVQRDDVKVRDTRSSLPPGPWASTSDRAFKYGPAGKELHALFPRMSVYETHPAPVDIRHLGTRKCHPIESPKG